MSAVPTRNFSSPPPLPAEAFAEKKSSPPPLPAEVFAEKKSTPTGNRYNRHSLIDWFKQEELSRAKVLVVGAGAVGNEVLKNLCLLGIGELRIVDFDKIEQHNLTRSVLFHSNDVGKYKAEVATLQCRQIDPNVRVSFDTMDFWNCISIGELKKFNAVICCVDNFEARIRLNQLCMIADVDLINTGIDSRRVSIELYPFSSAPDCACYECTLPPTAYSTIRQRYSCGWLRKIASEEKKIPTTTVTSSLAGAYAASIFLQRQCLHPERLQEAIRCYLDSITLMGTVSKIEHLPTCPACGTWATDSHQFAAQRQKLSRDLSTVVPDANMTIFLSEPIVLDRRCKKCGKHEQLSDLASNHTEQLAMCENCGVMSNEVRVVDSLPYIDLVRAFGTKPLPVKFLYFLREERQFIIELEDKNE